MARHLQLLTVLTMSNELSDTEFETDEQVVARALSIYRSAKAAGSAALMQEHVQSWAELWRGGEHDRLHVTFVAGLCCSHRSRCVPGGIELETDDLLLQQTTNSSWYYLLMSTRSDWIHSTLVPSTIAASAPYPHGYFVKWWIFSICLAVRLANPKSITVAGDHVLGP